MPSTPADINAAAARLEAQNRLDAARLKAAQLAATAKAAQDDANKAEDDLARHSGFNVDFSRLEPPRWRQDILVRPVNSVNAHLNNVLAPLDKMHTAFVMPYSITSAGGFFRAIGTVELSRAFWISNIIANYFTTSTQVAGGNRPGWVTIRDNATGYHILDNVQANALSTLASQNNQRSIWPKPYGIGAGGSFTIIVEVEAAASLVATEGQIMVEGFWDFTHV